MTRRETGGIDLVLVLALVGLAASTLTGCAWLAGWFEPGVDPDGAGPLPPAPSPNDTASTIAAGIGGPWGLAISQILTLANSIFVGVRALPAVQRKRHAKYSSAKVKPA